jgi:hypothetical protein
LDAPQPKRARAAGGGRKKGGKRGSAAAAAPATGDEENTDAAAAGGPLVVEQYQWLQCDEPMCGKWRRLKAGPFPTAECTFPPLETEGATLPTAGGSDAAAGDAAATEVSPFAAAYPLPTLTSLAPLRFSDVSAGQFFCWMNPQLAFTFCSAEEEVVEAGEVTIGAADAVHT